MAGNEISLCMNVREEERTLARCLDSVRDLGPEIVITDTGSTDATTKIASKFGARITSFNFDLVDFAAARNHGLAHAHGNWILMLDADETLEAAGITLIQELVSRDENAGYYVERLNRRPNPESSTTDYSVRLFPNKPTYRFHGRVHETVDASILAGGGRLLRSSIRVDHEFASDPERRREKNLWYIKILKEEIAADPSDSSRLDFLAAEYHQLGMFSQAAQIAERIVEVRPNDAVAHLHAGVYHFLYTGERDRARADFQTALKLRPNFEEAKSFLENLETAQVPLPN